MYFLFVLWVVCSYGFGQQGSYVAKPPPAGGAAPSFRQVKGSFDQGPQQKPRAPSFRQVPNLADLAHLPPPLFNTFGAHPSSEHGLPAQGKGGAKTGAPSAGNARATAPTTSSTTSPSPPRSDTRTSRAGGSAEESVLDFSS